VDKPAMVEVPEPEVPEPDVAELEPEPEVAPPSDEPAPAASRDHFESMPPPVFPAVDEDEPEPEGESRDLDARAMRALSRQERKQEKAALRREKQEARVAARQAKADAKAAGKESAVLAELGLAEAEAPEAEELETGPDTAATSDDRLEREPRDARARAAQRVQRRVGRDAERMSAAEMRAKAREEARQRRAQAKAMPGAVSAEEPVIRKADEPTAEMEAVEADVEETVVDAAPVVEPVVEADEVTEEVVEPEPAPEPAAEPERYVPPPSARIDPQIERKRESRWEPDRSPLPAADDDDLTERPLMAQIAGLVGLLGLVLSVVLAVGALLVAVGTEFGPLAAVCDAVVGPLKNAFEFSGTGAERKENFLAWGAGSVLYLLVSFVGQAVQRASSDGE
jgi:hypothetical protein